MSAIRGVPGLEAGGGWGESLGLRRLCRRRLRSGPDHPSVAGASAEETTDAVDATFGIPVMLGAEPFFQDQYCRGRKSQTPVIGTRLLGGFSGLDTVLYSVRGRGTTWFRHEKPANYSIDWLNRAGFRVRALKGVFGYSIALRVSDGQQRQDLHDDGCPASRSCGTSGLPRCEPRP